MSARIFFGSQGLFFCFVCLFVFLFFEGHPSTLRMLAEAKESANSLRVLEG